MPKFSIKRERKGRHWWWVVRWDGKPVGHYLKWHGALSHVMKVYEKWPNFPWTKADCA